MGAVWLQTTVKQYERKLLQDFITFLNGVIKKVSENVCITQSRYCISATFNIFTR